jgi:hypothetical protein
MCEETGVKEGDQQIGTGIGLGGRNRRMDRGYKRKLAARIRFQVVNVIAKETEKRSWRIIV